MSSGVCPFLCSRVTQRVTQNSALFWLLRSAFTIVPEDPKRAIRQPASYRIGDGNFVNLPAAYFGGEVL
jgi:hypothetical protein